MFNYFFSGIDHNDSDKLTNYINTIIDKKLKDIKVRIPQDQINDAVVKFFTEKKWFLTENGKKLDTYDLIRKFAMNTIGVAENGKLNPELLKVVQEEVGKIISNEYLKCSKDSIPTATLKKSDAESDNNFIDETPYEADYMDGYDDGIIDAVNDINELFIAEKYPIKLYWDGEKITLGRN